MISGHSMMSQLPVPIARPTVPVTAGIGARIRGIEQVSVVAMGPASSGVDVTGSSERRPDRRTLPGPELGQMVGMGRSAFGLAICDVIEHRPDEQVRGSDARRVVATMEGHLAIREGTAKGPSERYARRAGRDSVDLQPPVTGRSVIGRPQPTGAEVGPMHGNRAVLVDLLPEALLDTRTRPADLAVEVVSLQILPSPFGVAVGHRPLYQSRRFNVTTPAGQPNAVTTVATPPAPDEPPVIGGGE